MEDLKNVEWASFRDAFRPNNPSLEPKIDEEISKIVGKPIRVNNPVLIKLVAKWKKAKGDSDEPDNFLADEDKIKELREVL